MEHTVNNYKELISAVAWQIYLQETKGFACQVESWEELPEKTQELYLRKALARKGIIIKKGKI